MHHSGEDSNLISEEENTARMKKYNQKLNIHHLETSDNYLGQRTMLSMPL